MADDILIGDTAKAVRRRGRANSLKGSGRIWKHSGLADIHGVVSDADMADFFVVTLVRNPWDRMVSYYHWLRMQDWTHPAVERSKTLEFKEFLKDRTIQTSIEKSHFASYVMDKSGTERCNLFVRLEYLAKDIVPFETHLGFSLANIEHANKSTRDEDYRTYYTDETTEIVAGLCRRDIDRFGYSFG